MQQYLTHNSYCGNNILRHPAFARVFEERGEALTERRAKTGLQEGMMTRTEREIARRRGATTRALGGPCGEKMRKPSKTVQFRPIADPSEGRNSLVPCGETSLNPHCCPMPRKTRFWAEKPAR
jgi:hypothetical protein